LLSKKSSLFAGTWHAVSLLAHPLLIDMKADSILIVSFSHIGDAVLSTAVIHPLQRQFPNAKISIMLGPKAWEILWGDIRLNEIIIYDNRGQHAEIKEKIRLTKEIKAKKFDLIIDLRDSFWSRFMGGKRWGMPSIKRFDRTYNELHAVDRYLNVLHNHGIDETGGIPEIMLLDYEKQEAIDFLNKHQIKSNRTIIGIHPGGSWQYKLWKLDRFANLGDIVSERYDAKVLVFAGPDEKELQDQLYERMRYKPILVKDIGLRKLAALIQQCDLYIGNDTGPMHIASAVGTRVLSIFGSTNANRSGPYGNGNVVISTKIDCSPCHPGRHPGGCRRVSCLAMDSISLRQVSDVVGRILNEKQEWNTSC
jgi:heptosyltransferase-2